MARFIFGTVRTSLLQKLKQNLTSKQIENSLQGAIVNSFIPLFELRRRCYNFIHFRYLIHTRNQTLAMESMASISINLL